MELSIIRKSPILLLAHPDRHTLPKAVEAVSIEYDSLPPVFTIEESERQSEIIWGADNIFKTYLIQKGDVDGSLGKGRPHRRRRVLRPGAQEQLYIETNGVIAAFDAERGVTVWGSLQCPYYVHKALMALCNLPEDKSARGANGNGWRVRRQGRISVDDRGACGAAGDEVRAAGENYLRPRGGHGGDDEAASFADAASHGGQQRRKDSRRRNRVCD